MKRWRGGCMADEPDIQGRCRLGDLESTAPCICEVNLKKEEREREQCEEWFEDGVYIG